VGALDSNPWFQSTGIAAVIAAAMALNLLAAPLSGVAIPLISQGISGEGRSNVAFFASCARGIAAGTEPRWCPIEQSRPPLGAHLRFWGVLP